MTHATQHLLSRIRTVRGHRVLLDSDLAELYGVATKALVQAVKRNYQRFPPDFMFHLTEQEVRASRSQIVTLNEAGGRGHNVKYRPYAFTEQGVAMLSSVPRSERAVQVNVEIMRAFVRLRGLIGQNEDLEQRLDNLESRYDRQFKVVGQVMGQATRRLYLPYHSRHPFCSGKYNPRPSAPSACAYASSCAA